MEKFFLGKIKKVLFMFLTSLLIFFLGYWRMISLNESFGDVVVIFILGLLCEFN